MPADGNQGRHPGIHARQAPDRPAVVMAGTAQTLTYAEFEAASLRIARLFRSRGLTAGKRVAIMLGNEAAFLPLVWAAQRAGLRYTPVSPELTVGEALHIIRDCRAEVLVAGAAAVTTAAALPAERLPAVRARFAVGVAALAPGWEDLDAEACAIGDGPLDDECEGDCLVYSSGTTGRPKGVKRPLTLAPLGTGPDGAGPFLDSVGVHSGSVLLVTAPLWHSAALTWALSALRRGATVVAIERFSPAVALHALERYGITHSQWVPTMFARLLKAAQSDRPRWRFPAHQAAVHGAGPCAVGVKREMLVWWGPIVWELYSCTEGIGATLIGPDDWMAHPGSVGRAVLGRVVIRDDDGDEVPSGAVGNIWFADGYPYAYENDPAKTKAARNPLGETTVGDIGYVDAGGYLYLTGRKAHTVVSGGVNIYPREIEDCIMSHRDVADVAVLGLPDTDLGERLVAVVEEAQGDGEVRGDLNASVLAHCRDRLARFKVPREVLVVDRLPRDGAGKIARARIAALMRAGPGAGVR